MEVTGRGGRASPGKDNGVLGAGEEAAKVAHLVLQHLATTSDYFVGFCHILKW